jgi:hypothetical protein
VLQVLVAAPAQQATNALPTTGLARAARVIMIPCQPPPALAGRPATPAAATTLDLQDLVVLPLFELVSAIRVAGADQLSPCVMVAEAPRPRKGGIEWRTGAPLVPAVLADLSHAVVA